MGGANRERQREGAKEKEGTAGEKGQKLSAHQVPDPGPCVLFRAAHPPWGRTVVKLCSVSASPHAK